MASKEAFKIQRKILGLILQRARLKAGKSLKECAQVLYISPRTLSQIEQGRKDISLPQLEVLAGFLNVPLSRLWTDELEENNASEFHPPPEEAFVLRRKVIGILLREAREKAGKTLKESAAAIGISPRRLSAYENGKKDIPVVELEALARFYGVETEFFLQEPLVPLDDREKLEREIRAFRQLPPEIREFITKPSNILYLKSAMCLSEMSAEELRKFAETLLDITL